jgi:hypothetical protein
MSNYIWDIFLCHASEDKEDVARPLATLLMQNGISVWIDEFEIRLGDSLRQKIDEGLSKSRFGGVILSPNFFAKKWTRAELGALFSRQIGESKVLLPVWHQVSVEDVRQASPLLADIRASSTGNGIASVVEEITQTILRSGKSHRPGTPIFSGKLTKKALLELPEGSYLHSNCSFVNDKLRIVPKFSHQISSYYQRSELWLTIKKLGIAYTKFYAFKNELDYHTYLEQQLVWDAIIELEDGSRWLATRDIK